MLLGVSNMEICEIRQWGWCDGCGDEFIQRTMAELLQRTKHHGAPRIDEILITGSEGSCGEGHNSGAPCDIPGSSWDVLPAFLFPGTYPSCAKVTHLTPYVLYRQSLHDGRKNGPSARRLNYFNLTII